MKCEICGKEISESRYLGMTICSTECFNIMFWRKTLDDSAIIINRECYHDGGNRPNSRTSFLGFGGRRFTIKMNNGNIIHTNNLWDNGKIPDEFILPDNAIFIKEHS